MSISKRLLRTLITATLLTAFLATFVPTAYTQGTTAVNRTADNLTGREPAPAAQSRFLPGDEPQPAERAETLDELVTVDDQISRRRTPTG